MTTARRAGPAPPALRFGALLRSLRDARGLKQAQLTARANVSARHLSFLETGRAVPSRDMVLALADALELPLRARNDLLVAAGFGRSSPPRRSRASRSSPCAAPSTTSCACTSRSPRW